MVTATSGIRLRGRWNMALQNEGLNRGFGPSRFLRRDMLVLPPLLLAYVLLFPPARPSAFNKTAYELLSVSLVVT
jgi:hypothetical protein